MRSIDREIKLVDKWKWWWNWNLFWVVSLWKTPFVGSSRIGMWCVLLGQRNLGEMTWSIRKPVEELWPFQTLYLCLWCVLGELLRERDKEIMADNIAVMSLELNNRTHSLLVAHKCNRPNESCYSRLSVSPNTQRDFCQSPLQINIFAPFTKLLKTQKIY